MRARNIKPGFFRNEELAELSPLTRILFAGLWCLADREGRLEDRPRRIKADILPYDNCNVDKLLNDLQEKNFILRYKNQENQYIQVLNFKRHQNPHVREPESEIPAPGLHSAKPVLEQDEHGSGPADSGFRIPDSPSLIPDSNKTALESAVDDFKSFRKKIKAPMTDRAVELLLINLDKLANDDDAKIAILNQSIVNGWKGVFQLKDAENGNGRHPPQPQMSVAMQSLERWANEGDEAAD